MKKKKKKMKPKTYLYTIESLGKKEKTLKLLISLLETILLLPIIETLFKILNISTSKFVLLLILFAFFFLCFYLINNKKYQFIEWEFLDDKVNIFTDKKLDGETKDFFIDKFTLIIGINIIVVIPFSLTFSVIIASVISFIFNLFLETLFVNLIKFILIIIIFKQFFGPCNNVLIKYLDTEKELYD